MSIAFHFILVNTNVTSAVAYVINFSNTAEYTGKLHFHDKPCCCCGSVIAKTAKREKTKEENKQYCSLRNSQPETVSETDRICWEVGVECKKFSLRSRSQKRDSEVLDLAVGQQTPQLHSPTEKEGEERERGRGTPLDVEIFKGAQVWKTFHVRLPEEKGKKHSWMRSQRASKSKN